MVFQVFLVVSAAVLLLTWLVYETIIPFLIEKYNRSQEEKAAKLTAELEEAFVFWEKKRMVVLYFAPLIFAGIGFLLSRHIAGIIIGFLIGLSFPDIMAKITKMRRMQTIQGQLVDTAVMLSSSLKAGLSFLQAIEVVGEEMPPPISHEFKLVLKENKLGVSLEESLRSLRKRIPLEEMNLMISSILIARESGGELPKVLMRLTTTIRDNLKLKEKVATLTLQGKLQGLIMMFLPFIFAYFVYKQNPGHFDIMFETPVGKTLIIVAVSLQIIGMFLIHKISRPRI